MFEEFKEKLRIELSNDLPGESAHSMMIPTVRDDTFQMPANQPQPTKSAVLILFYREQNGTIKFPWIQRPTYNGAHSAQVSFPGGKAEKSDRNLVHTALREAEEEIGIDSASVEVIGNLSDLFIWVSNYMVTPVIAFTHQKPKFIKDDLEVDEIIETNLYDILNPEKRKEGTILARGKYKIQTPYFDIDNRIVWGATAMMLSELSMVIGKTGIF
ncbi:MAG: CoA pyrophosphatase [Cyclobacteriaceae bacterium]|nr:CoA pyrophosphatase [Cyclobacteriaceae bacterium]